MLQAPGAQAAIAHGGCSRSTTRAWATWRDHRPRAAVAPNRHQRPDLARWWMAAAAALLPPPEMAGPPAPMVGPARRPAALPADQAHRRRLFAWGTSRLSCWCSAPGQHTPASRAKPVAHRMMELHDMTPAATAFAALVAPPGDAGRTAGAASHPYPLLPRACVGRAGGALEALLGPPPTGWWRWKYDGIRAAVKPDGQCWIWSRGERLVTERIRRSSKTRALPTAPWSTARIVAWIDGLAPFSCCSSCRALERWQKVLAEAPVGFILRPAGMARAPTGAAASMCGVPTRSRGAGLKAAWSRRSCPAATGPRSPPRASGRATSRGGLHAQAPRGALRR